MRSGSLLLILAFALTGPALVADGTEENKAATATEKTQEPAACPVGTDARTDLAKGKAEGKANVKPGTFEDVVQGDVSRAKEAAASRASSDEAAPVWESEDGDKPKAKDAKGDKEAKAEKAKKAKAAREKGR